MKRNSVELTRTKECIALPGMERERGKEQEGPAGEQRGEQRQDLLAEGLELA